MSRREKEPWRDSSCDNSCMFGPPGGMATNCGCDCLDAEKDREKRVRIRKGVQSLRDGIRDRDAEIVEQAAEIARLKSDIQLMAAPHESVGAVVLALRAEIARLREAVRLAAGYFSHESDDDDGIEYEPCDKDCLVCQWLARAEVSRALEDGA